MKSFYKFSRVIALGLTLLSFILLMATASVTVKGEIWGISFSGELTGIEGIFGTKNVSAPWAGLMAWIFILVALIVLALVVILPLLKVNALDKYSELLTLVAAILLVVAGIFTFCETAAVGSGTKLGVGWIISAVVSILSGVCAALPLALNKKN